MANYYSPKELVAYVEQSSVSKANRDIVKLFVLAIFAGAFIGFGAIASYVVSGSLVSSNPGVAKFLGASVFPVGLIMVILGGFELFTSDCLMTIGVASKKINTTQLLKTLVIVYIGNFVGSLIVSYVTLKSHTLYPAAQEALAHTAQAKVSADAFTIFLKGIFANILVAGGGLLSYAAKDYIGKMGIVWFAIMLFIVLGYEHSVANMTYITTSMMLKEPITIAQLCYNLLFSTLGNFVGGGIIVGLGYYYTQK